MPKDGVTTINKPYKFKSGNIVVTLNGKGGVVVQNDYKFEAFNAIPYHREIHRKEVSPHERKNILFSFNVCCWLWSPIDHHSLQRHTRRHLRRDARSTALRAHQMRIDATSWTDWYYMDFDSLAMAESGEDAAALHRLQTTFKAYPIPKEPTKKTDNHRIGIYTYWFDVLGKGLLHNECRAFTATENNPNQSRGAWRFTAIMCAQTKREVLETQYTRMEDLPESSEAFADAAFTPDEWSENKVWVDRTEMLNEIIKCQGIKTNPLLSSWLQISIPPFPPCSHTTITYSSSD